MVQSTHVRIFFLDERVYGAGGHLPSVTIEYRDIEIEADALVGSDSIPSLTNAFWHAVKVSSFPAG